MPHDRGDPLITVTGRQREEADRSLRALVGSDYDAWRVRVVSGWPSQLAEMTPATHPVAERG